MGVILPALSSSRRAELLLPIIVLVHHWRFYIARKDEASRLVRAEDPPNALAPGSTHEPPGF